MEDEIIAKAEKIVMSMISALVDRVDLAAVKIEITSSVLLIQISVGSDETGKVIGKGGRNASALRAIMGAYGARNRLKSIVEIEES